MSGKKAINTVAEKSSLLWTFMGRKVTFLFPGLFFAEKAMQKPGAQLVCSNSLVSNKVCLTQDFTADNLASSTNAKCTQN